MANREPVIVTPHQQRRDGSEAPPDLDKIREKLENASGGGINPGINERGEIIFSPAVKQADKAGGITAEKPADSGKDGVDRIKTAIPGLDELITGGIPRGSVILAVGGPGSGKSTFSLQFLVNGAEKFNEAGAYISFEEPEGSIRESAKLFGWDIDALEKKGMLTVAWRDPYEIKSFAEAMSGQIYYLLKEHNVKRIVFDSITYFSLTESDRFKLRKEISELSRRLKSLNITSVFIAEVPEGEAQAGRYGMEDFVADGVILLHNYLIRDSRLRAIEILKLRKTLHDTYLHPFKITSRGIEIYPQERVFTE